MIDQFITALNQELDLSAKEIADILWLARQMEESQWESVPSNFPPINPDEREREKKEEKLVEEPSPEPQSHTADSISNSEETPTNQVSEEQKAGIYPRNQSSSLDLAFKAPNAPSLQQPLTLARALKPLMRQVPASTNLVLDEAATSEKIARERLWLPVLRPTLEPWLDLELVVDGSISMVIWRQTVRDLERLLKNYGIFRDVRVWVLMEDDREGVQIRRGMGARAKNQPSRSAKELINTSGRSLVLVVSDCVSSLWRDGKVTKTLELWANHVPTAIIQMLPKWLWKRTALGRTSEVRLRALTTGVCNRNLILQQLSLWEELEPEEVVKVPVFTLEEDRVATWAQMLSGNSSIWTAGVGFKLDNSVQEEKGLFNGNSSELSAEQRVQAFRVTASPMARKLAGLLAAAPVISLPVVRLIRETLLPDSLQVNVAEVFLGGLLKPLAEIGLDTNPDEILYEFIDGVRDLLIDSVPTNYVLNVVDEVSKYMAKKVGLSLEDFAAVLRKDKKIEDSNLVEKIDYFATITAQVLRNLGGEYAKLAEELEVNLGELGKRSEFQCLRTIGDYISPVFSVAISTDGQTIVSGDKNGIIKIWNLATGQLLRTLKGHSDWVTSVAISSDNQTVVSCSYDKTVKIWNLATGELLGTLEGHSGWINSVAISSDNKTVVSGSSDKTVKIWNLATGELLGTLEGHSHWVNSVAISTDNNIVVSGSRDKTVKIWNLATGELLRTLKGHSHWVNSVAISTDNKIVISGSRDNTVKIWNLARGQLLRTLEGHFYSVNSVAISTDNNIVVSGSRDKTVKIWNLARGKLLQSLEGHPGWVRSVAISTDNKTFVSGSSDKTVKIWNLATGELLQSLEGHSGWVRSVAISSDNNTVVSGSDDKTVKIWNLARGQLLQSLKGHSNWVNSVAISSDNNTVVSGSDDKTVKIWNLARGQLLQSLKGHSNWVNSVAISTDNKIVVSGSSDNTVKIWNLARGELLRTLKGHSNWVNSVAISTDNKTVVSGSRDNTVKIWNLARGELLRTLKGHSHWVYSVAISTDNNIVVSGSSDETVKIWNLATGELLHTLKGHVNTVSSVACIFNGEIIVSGSEDGTIKIWQH